LLGVALSYVLQWPMTLSVFLMIFFQTLLVGNFIKDRNLGTSTLITAVAQGSLALGLVVMALSHMPTTEMSAVLLGDILAVSYEDLYILVGVFVGLMCILALLWKALLFTIIDEDFAIISGYPIGMYKLITTTIVATVIALSLKMVGALLLASLIIVPSATARDYVKSPEGMVGVAAIVGIVAVILGLLASYHFDTPTGPTIAATLFVLFISSRFFKRIV
jgi:zinc transport system permease protein